MLHLKKYPLKMPGCKRNVIGRIFPHFPTPTTGRVIVPFFGTGADSYDMHFAQGLEIVGADLQPMLIELHRDPLGCYDQAARWLAAADWPHNRPHVTYSSLRKAHNDYPQAWTYFLLGRLSFNGLVRHNRSGAFNAPVGTLRENPLPDRSRMVEHARFIRAIGGVSFADFRDTCALAQPGDLVYLDPPYFGGFDAYIGPKFDHCALFDQLHDLIARGISFACSNAGPGEVIPGKAKSLGAAPYMPQACEVIELTRAGIMSSKGNARQPVSEILAVYRAA